jgi:hypothetical protein
LYDALLIAAADDFENPLRFNARYCAGRRIERYFFPGMKGA